MPVTGLEPVRGCPRGILSPLRLPIPPHQRTHCVILYCMDLRAKHCSIELINANGWRWIRTTEANCSRFTVCPLWPLGNPSIFFLFDGTNRARTYDPLLVRQMLSQLSYDPKYSKNKATRMGIEPTTSAVTGRRSNQLSHRAKYFISCMKLLPGRVDLQGLEPGTDRL